MLNRLLGLDETDQLSYFDWAVALPWVGLMLAALAAVAIIFVIFLYRRERTLSRGKRLTLMVCRIVAIILVLVVLFEPVVGTELVVTLPRTILVLLDASESMGIEDRRTHPEELKDAALALGEVPFERAEQPVPERITATVTQVARRDLARGVLIRSGAFDRLGEEYKVRYFTFGEELVPAKGEGAESLEDVGPSGPGQSATRLGTAIDEAVSQYGGQPIAGVVTLTDGAFNAGLEPLEVARSLGKRDIPLFPIGFGLPNPPDVRVQRLLAQDTVFCKDRVAIRLALSSEGYNGRGVDVSIRLDGQEVAQKRLTLAGGVQYEELFFTPTDARDSAQLEAVVARLAGDMAPENNRQSATVRVIDEKIKVLYVEGKPRWEYRYLRQVLLRDHRLDVKFLLTEGDRDLAERSPRYLPSLPTDPGKLFEYDIVILGDVPAAYFSAAQRTRLEELIRERGGSFLMLAGHRHTPGEYIKTPIAQALPVTFRRSGWEEVGDAVHPVITETGRGSSFMAVEPLAERNREVWRQVKPLYQIPQIEGAKGGAYVLATLSSAAGRREAYPLIAWQRYGSGKTLFVGTDQLWRLRFKRGDTYHARFWGQAIRFLTLSRLLGENKRIHLETERRDYRTGEWVRISANVLNEYYEPVTAESYLVQVDRVQPRRDRVELRLAHVPDIPGFYQGMFAPDEAGSYVLKPTAGQKDLANTVAFEVTAVSMEELEPAMQEGLLRHMAELSGGSYVSIRQIPRLPQIIAARHEDEQKTATVKREEEVWDIPALFVVLLMLMGTEWFLRRTFDLL